MNAAHFHLILNHVPVITTFFAIVLLIWGYFNNNRDIIKVALWGFIVAAVATIPVFLSGHAAEDIVENISGVAKNLIDSHEEMAEITLWLSVFMGMLGIVALIIERKLYQFFRPILMILIVSGVITIGSLSYTGYLGGHIHHPEITNQNMGQNQDAGQEIQKNNDED